MQILGNFGLRLDLLMNYLELLALDHLKVKFLIVSKLDEVRQKLFFSN